jgi:hypothetical protein
LKAAVLESVKQASTAMVRWWLHMRLHGCGGECDEYRQLWGEWEASYATYLAKREQNGA